VIGAVSLPWPGWVAGLLVGFVLSLGEAIVTKAYVPIMVFGSPGRSRDRLYRREIRTLAPTFNALFGVFFPLQ
jgi:hypothetical protein